MIKINRLKEKRDVYDVQVVNTNNFYANNILVHNCEIVEYSDENTTAICNLSSMILKNFVKGKKFDYEELYKAVRVAVKSLNKVIDINHYSTEKGRKGGLEQRAIAIGVQGLADAIYLMDLDFTSEEARLLNKQIFETIYFAALTESCDLVKKGIYKPYDYFEGSPYSKGIFQFDMWGVKSDQLSWLWDWESLRKDIVEFGVCNSLVTAAMPTACQTSDTRIRTSEGILSFRDIMEEQGINCSEIEKSVIGGKWFDFNDEIGVETLEGIININRICYNGHVPIYEIEMEDGVIFKCSGEHKFFIRVWELGCKWETVSLLRYGDLIVTNDDKNLKITKISITEPQPTWDIEVPKVHHYITENGCISHNSSAKITDSYEMFEPMHSNIFVRRVIGGEFTIVNRYLINDLEKLGIWCDELKNEIILNDGSIQKVNFLKYIESSSDPKNYENKIKRIDHLIKKYRTIWEFSQKDLMNMAIDRAIFIDQTQSMNVYFAEPTLPKLTSSHFYAWKNGLKTGCYYVRTKAISTGAKHLAMDLSAKELSEEEKEMVELNRRIQEENKKNIQKPVDSNFECDGCSS